MQKLIIFLEMIISTVFCTLENTVEDDIQHTQNQSRRCNFEVKRESQDMKVKIGDQHASNSGHGPKKAQYFGDQDGCDLFTSEPSTSQFESSPRKQKRRLTNEKNSLRLLENPQRNITLKMKLGNIEAVKNNFLKQLLDSKILKFKSEDMNLPENRRYNLTVGYPIATETQINIVKNTNEEDLSSSFFKSSHFEVIESVKKELVNVKKVDNIYDLENIIAYSEKIYIFGIKSKKTFTKLQLQEMLTSLEIRNVKEELQKYRNIPSFYEFMLFKHRYADNIIDHIEEGCFLMLTENDLSKAYKNLSYKNKIDLEIQPLKIILMHIYLGLKNGLCLFKKYIIVYLLEFTHLFITEKILNLCINDDFGRNIFSLYHYIYDDSMSLQADLFLRIGNALAFLSLHNYHTSQDINLSFSKIMNHISQKSYIITLQAILRDIFPNCIHFSAFYPELFTNVGNFIENITLTEKWEDLDSRIKILFFKFCIKYAYMLRHLLSSDYHYEKMVLDSSMTQLYNDISSSFNEPV
ncbi:hypothetical protein CWI36_1124p0010 [Hamiltosporidium magnivora]|uniref:Uncharacterized protein n=1 Tax=Hamiltosporidium magnivora TaxID=148818 RepID=A0A4Q9L6B5_9MICR|nr:hypothetical protein CWI36_1124p0010 [Hamiltosporidium magnivora]